MTKRLLILGFLLPLVPAMVAVAHEDQRHIMGTVKSIHAGELVVEAQDGKTVSILLTEDTAYRGIAEEGKTGVTAKDADLKPGSRVVVDVGSEGPELTATQVRFSSVPKHAGGGGEQRHHPEVP